MVRLPQKTGTHLLKTTQKYCACHTKRPSTRYKTRLNVRKCHACHAKRSNATFETSKSGPLCRTYHRHGHSDLAPTVANGCGRSRAVANGCGRLRTVADGWGNVERTHTQPPDPQSETGTLTTHSGKKIPTCHYGMTPEEDRCLNLKLTPRLFGKRSSENNSTKIYSRHQVDIWHLGETSEKGTGCRMPSNVFRDAQKISHFSFKGCS